MAVLPKRVVPCGPPHLFPEFFFAKVEPGGDFLRRLQKAKECWCDRNARCGEEWPLKSASARVPANSESQWRRPWREQPARAKARGGREAGETAGQEDLQLPGEARPRAGVLAHERSLEDSVRARGEEKARAAAGAHQLRYRDDSGFLNVVA